MSHVSSGKWLFHIVPLGIGRRRENARLKLAERNKIYVIKKFIKRFGPKVKMKNKRCVSETQNTRTRYYWILLFLQYFQERTYKLRCSGKGTFPQEQIILGIKFA